MQLRNGKNIYFPIYAFEQKDLILIFDVETTGLLPKIYKNQASPPAIEEFPYVIQLSYVIFHNVTKQIVKTFNRFIKVNVEISEKITEITGITKEICENAGIPIQDALIELYSDIHHCGHLVAHNYNFDKTVLQTEFYRNGPEIESSCPNYKYIFHADYLLQNNIQAKCTMMMGISICKIPFPNNPTSKSYKYPNLAELHNHLFGIVPNGLHNSYVDVIACLSCYLSITSHDQ